MIALHPQYVVDEKGARVAVQLPADEFERLLEELEMTEDLAAYDRAKAVAGEAVPYEQVRRELGLGQ